MSLSQSDKIGTFLSASGQRFGSRLFPRLSRRAIISTALASFLGFGFGFACHALWRGLVALYTRQSHDNRITSVATKLAKVEVELKKIKHLLRSIDGQNIKRLQFDVDSENQDSDFDDFLDAESPPSSIGDNPADVVSGCSDGTSFVTALGTSGSSRSLSKLGPAVPVEVLTELDQLAAAAIESQFEPQTVTVTSSGDTLPPGQQAYSKCLVYKIKYCRSPEYLWRLARATFLASNEIDDVDNSGEAVELQESASTTTLSDMNDLNSSLLNKRQFIQHGLTAARRALSLSMLSQDLSSQSRAAIYRWLAVLVGVAANSGGRQQRIMYGHEFKELIDKAIEQDPSDAWSYHLRGRWCFLVYNLSWVERQLASRLFATPPQATLEEAEADLRQSESMSPNKWPDNHLYLAKCCLARSMYKEAGCWLRSAENLLVGRVKNAEVEETKTEVLNLLYKYANYF